MALMSGCDFPCRASGADGKERPGTSTTGFVVLPVACWAQVSSCAFLLEQGERLPTVGFVVESDNHSSWPLRVGTICVETR